jgi:hypothetical protein
MKAILLPAALCVGLASTLAVHPAEAKGCIKGALVGGVAGHFAGHHGLLGAAAGCAVGHHMAAKRARAARQNEMTDNGAGTTGVDNSR